VLPVAVTELLRLITEADTVESKRRILGILNVVIESAGVHVGSLLQCIISRLKNHTKPDRTPDRCNRVALATALCVWVIY
jgi:hypothetical protein